jgi:hypothetical protein
MSNKKKSILLGLNEINFLFVEEYIKLGYLSNFKKLFSKYGYIKTTSEKDYELLEPWIQWVSIHTGKTYAEHHVFRLGDIVKRNDLKQLWEIAEEKGLSVGAVSPFNAKNNLKNPLFFVPDPWTQTTPSGDKTLINLSAAVSSVVNENANQKIGISAAKDLMKGTIKYVPAAHYPHYIKLASKITRKATKAAILDNILSDVFLTLWKKTKPDFSSLFLNAGAHEQHHYMFNSKVYKGDQKNPDWYIKNGEDPLLDILIEYDAVIAKLVSLDCRLFIATGLHQNPHLHTTFYWRLKNHAEFLKLIGVDNFTSVIPRMSRDFLIDFSSNNDALTAEKKLRSIYLNNKQVFTIDNRGNSLFIELTFDENVKENSLVYIGDNFSNIDLYNYVSFVAIKNGEHDGIGYFIDTERKCDPGASIPVTEVFNEIVKSFS